MKTKNLLGLFLLALLLPLQALAVELTIRNEEASPARVALAYARDQHMMVEGWINLAAEESTTINLHGVIKSNVYVHIVFDDARIEQYETTKAGEFIIQESDFRYAMPLQDAQSGPSELKGTRVPFSTIDEFDANEEQLFLNLSFAAG